MFYKISLQTSSYGSSDPSKPVDAFGDGLSRRHFENFYDKSSGDSGSPNPLENKPSISDSNDVDKNVADDLSARRSNDDNDDATSRNGDDDGDVKKEASMIDNLDTIPFIPDIPDIKPDDVSQRDNPDPDRLPGSDPSSPMRCRRHKTFFSGADDKQE